MHIRDMLTGYARVSTDDQDLRLQRGLLTKAGCRRIFEEKGSSANRDRLELARLFDQIRADDVVVVVSRATEAALPTDCDPQASEPFEAVQNSCL